MFQRKGSIHKRTPHVNEPIDSKNDNVLDTKFPMEEIIPEQPPKTSRRYFSEEDFGVEMGFVTEVAEQILNEGLDVLAIISQQFDNPGRSKVLWIGPSEDKVLVNEETVVPNAVGESPNDNTMLGASHYISLLSIIYQFSNHLTLEREQWR